MFCTKGLQAGQGKNAPGRGSSFADALVPKGFFTGAPKCEIWTAMNAAENADCLRGQCWYGERLKKSNGPVHWTGQFGQPISTQTARQ
ncbi:MAG: hypothetical protein KA752_09330, partial [Giesbergeria sp.]|nr:hypothetical protein [Giesbergeria sp.]